MSRASWSGFITHMSQNGIIQEVQEVTRGSRRSVSSAAISTDDKLNLDNTIEIYLSDLCSRNAWPDQTQSALMAKESLLQLKANACARNASRNETAVNLTN